MTEGSRYFSGKLINVPYTGPVLRGVRIQYAVTCCLAVVSVLSTVIIWIDACTTASSHRVQAMLWNLRAMSGSRRNIHCTTPVHNRSSHANLDDKFILKWGNSPRLSVCLPLPSFQEEHSSCFPTCQINLNLTKYIQNILIFILLKRFGIKTYYMINLMILFCNINISIILYN